MRALRIDSCGRVVRQYSSIGQDGRAVGNCVRSDVGLSDDTLVAGIVRARPFGRRGEFNLRVGRPMSAAVSGGNALRLLAGCFRQNVRDRLSLFARVGLRAFSDLFAEALTVHKVVCLPRHVRVIGLHRSDAIMRKLDSPRGCEPNGRTIDCCCGCSLCGGVTCQL